MALSPAWSVLTDSPCAVKVFDVLYMKIKDRPARSLIAYPLSERRSVLQKFVTPKTGRLELAEFRTGTSARDIKDRMAWILDKQ